MMTDIQKRDVIQAQIDGKPIECKVFSSPTWIKRIGKATFDFSRYDYRVSVESTPSIPQEVYVNQYKESSYNNNLGMAMATEEESKNCCSTNRGFVKRLRYILDLSWKELKPSRFKILKGRVYINGRGSMTLLTAKRVAINLKAYAPIKDFGSYGTYLVRRNPDGKITIGCVNDIEWKEIDDFAKSQGWWL